MNDDMFDARTYGLLAEFDSLGFLPTTLTPDILLSFTKISKAEAKYLGYKFDK